MKKNIIDNMWEKSLFNWNEKCFKDRVVSINLIISLAFAETKEQANNSFDELQSIVLDNRIIFDCAPVVVKTILSILPQSSEFGKMRCLELLVDIACSKSHIDSSTIVGECLEELKQNTWYFLHGLQFDNPINTVLYVDILGVLGYHYKEMAQKIIMYLEMALTRNIQDMEKELIENTIADVRSNL